MTRFDKGTRASILNIRKIAGVRLLQEPIPEELPTAPLRAELIQRDPTVQAERPLFSGGRQTLVTMDLHKAHGLQCSVDLLILSRPKRVRLTLKLENHILQTSRAAAVSNSRTVKTKL